MKSMMIAASVAGVLALASGASQAQLVTNGGFDTPAPPPGGFDNYTSGSSGVTGWVVVGNEVSIVSTTFAENGRTFMAQSGVGWLDLTGDGANSAEGVSQAIATTANHHYELTFYVGNTTGAGGVYGTDSTVNVLLNGVQSYAAVNSLVSPTSLTWQQFTYDFVASGASTTLALMNGDPGSDNSNALDSLAIVDLGALPAVPEPGSSSLLLAGLGAMAWLARRRQGLGR